MNEKVKKMLKLFKTEQDFVENLIYRSKNQFRTNFRQRKLVLLIKYLKLLSQDIRRYGLLIDDLTEVIYIYCSGEVSHGHFLPINYIVMGAVSRIKYLLNKLHPLCFLV